MGFLGWLFNAIENNFEEKADRYSSGYGSGSNRASNMSNSELRDSIRRKVDGGVSDWKTAGEVRAMADEYKNRK